MTSRIDIGLAVKFAAAAFAAVAIGVAAWDFSRNDPQPVAAPPSAKATDPLAAELARCRTITDPALIDSSCRRAWAERRDRFFGAPR